jgi:cbb3-type cytochrome oxidase cytochrome c subunit
MTRTLNLILAAIAAIAISIPASAAAQGGLKLDPNLAKRGKTVWMNNGCYICHTFGRRLAGPDLAGILDRRDHDWLRRWLKETESMLNTDPQAQAMLEEWKFVRMPQIKLRDADVDALFHYMEQASREARGG